ncbi:androglobin-like [Fopius arisanus]|uniref:Androglobin-like n=1 Tax=Fopius arisanus TaxID=64838 RepID=A0A9R1T7I5_9HYME|nr:PREDICTED: androglobin-like [Fopius arisanus]
MEKKANIPWNLWSDVSKSETWDDQPLQPFLLPQSLAPHEWKRFPEIDNAEIVLCDSTDSPDLFSNNRHLLHSEFIRWFCCTLRILNYSHKVDGKKWQGWHHIFSPNKSRRSSDRNPQINPNGTKNLLQVGTRGCAARTLCLNPGRHLLRIFCQSREHYYLTISSDTVFHIGDRMRVQDLMTSESERIEFFAEDVHRRLKTAINSLSTPNDLTDLRDFYQSYMPREIHSKKFCKLDRWRIHERFKAEFLDTAGKKCRENGRRALKIFFMSLESRGGDKTPGADDDTSPAAVKIQSFFRMLRAKKYLRLRQGNDREHEEVKRTLEEVLEAFDTKTMCQVVRNLVNGMGELGMYPCSSDFQNVLEIQKMRGTALVSPGNWVPMVRQNLMVRPGEIVFAALDLFVELPGYSLRCFDNDTSKEVFRAVNNVMPFHYKGNRTGFTVVGYGWTDEDRPATVNWTLHITTRRGSSQFLGEGQSQPLPSMTEDANPAIYELSNIYIPNYNNCLAKATLRVSRKCILSLRLKTSYPKAKITLRVSSTEIMIKEFSGVSAVFLPVVRLDCEVEYLIQGFVLEKSWPLTEDEWRCVQRAKSDLEERISSSGLSGNFVERRTLRAGDSLENPHWSLQILCDPDIIIELQEDVRRDLEMLETKLQWRSQDPGRSDRGKNLREEFRDKISIERCNFEFSEEEQATPPGDDEEIRTLSPPRDRRRLPPLDLPRQAPGTRGMLQEQIQKRTSLLKFEEKSRYLMQRLEMTLVKSLGMPIT